ncbi:alkaline phosphatase family protein [Pseudarcicella hirudinis]|nr:alkaline phosphatase family protein [Pseudarcicella hirudinis]
MKKALFTLILAFILFTGFGQEQRKTENVFLITTDGFRWKEVFGGIDSTLLNDGQYTKDAKSLKQKYWSDTLELRRSKLLPFFWKTIASKGQLHGNRDLGSLVNVTNQQWFSYPGYNEILAGFSDDEKINSNDKIDNPNTTVLEFLNQQKELKGRIAAFSTWDCFPFIINEKRTGIPVNSGKELVEGKLSPKEELLNEIQTQVPNQIADRHDFVTYHLAKEYVKNKHPKVLFLAFDETDDYAHAGNYEGYLQAAQNFDTFLKDLWDLVQSDPQYKDKTTFIITSDHGRGIKPKSKWTDHGYKTAYSDQIWFATMGPDTKALGEIKTSEQLYQNQIAKTLAAFLGFDYKSNKTVGDKIELVLKK